MYVVCVCGCVKSVTNFRWGKYWSNYVWRVCSLALSLTADHLTVEPTKYVMNEVVRCVAVLPSSMEIAIFVCTALIIVARKWIETCEIAPLNCIDQGYLKKCFVTLTMTTRIQPTPGKQIERKNKNIRQLSDKVDGGNLLIRAMHFGSLPNDLIEKSNVSQLQPNYIHDSMTNLNRTRTSLTIWASHASQIIPCGSVKQSWVYMCVCVSCRSAAAPCCQPMNATTIIYVF